MFYLLPQPSFPQGASVDDKQANGSYGLVMAPSGDAPDIAQVERLSKGIKYKPDTDFCISDYRRD